MAPSKNVTSLFLLRLALALLCASSAAASTSDGWSNDCQAAINNARATGGKMSDAQCATCQSGGCCATNQLLCYTGSATFYDCTSGSDTSPYGFYGNEELQWCKSEANGTLISVIVIPIVISIIGCIMCCCFGCACCPVAKQRANLVILASAAQQQDHMIAMSPHAVVYMQPAPTNMPPRVQYQLQQQAPAPQFAATQAEAMQYWRMQRAAAMTNPSEAAAASVDMKA